MDSNYKRIKKRQQEHEKYDSVPAVFFFYKDTPLFYGHFQHSSNTAGSSLVHGFQTSAPALFGLPVFMKFTQYTSVLTALYSSKPPCLIFHRTVLASIDVATGYASFSRLANEKLSCGVLPDIMRSVH